MLWKTKRCYQLNKGVITEDRSEEKAEGRDGVGTKATLGKTEQKKQDQNPVGTFREQQTDHAEINDWLGEAWRKACRGARRPGGECQRYRSRFSGASVGHCWAHST